ncbi:hypothetical protein BLS_007183 [Venturia inaequalis]|uniref:Uncharacterized protein n=1 Tax=Venturia inaequalis TaxID=5025 RepID=A0A8H3UAS0_VENIN|nr:hypothetical protein BLS_007183 [Venturia inaequalis]KAE9972297.1 hypothetical protein EG327_009528 [Venturia inaequalis]KAE9987186.1 hypothetical protein EG328_003655 [Venturia inaequalis]RDI86103.1 hypothetical protein Vi05172_g3807 [Venturia inaequalis]
MALVPLNPVLGPNPKYCFPEPHVLQMKEKAFSLSGDDFSIRTASGLEVCRCKGKVLSISDKKVFTDLQGNKLFDLKNKHLALFKSFKAVGPDGSVLFRVKGHFSVLSSKSTVEFTNAADGRHVELEVKGDWFDRSATITYGGQQVASIGRSFFNIREVFADKQTYFVKVAPGVDLTMIAALCVCLDERENEK